MRRPVQNLNLAVGDHPACFDGHPHGSEKILRRREYEHRHLDFRVYRNGGAINPLKLESPPAEPVPDSLRSQFFAIKDSLKQILDNDFKKIYQNNIQ